MKKRSPLFSLLLILPAPSIGVLFGMVLMPGSPMGQGLFFLSKVWIFLLPAVWFFAIEHRRLPRNKTAKGGFRMGWITGLVISAFILLMYRLLGQRLIDHELVHDMAQQIGLSNPTRYLLSALYWFTINSILEEYVWRWFVVRQFARLMRPAAAITLSALAFTLHHIIAMQVYFSLPVILIGTAGIAIGGATWSWMFLRYKTIWPGWLSHALVDITIFAIGYQLIFG